MPDGLILHNLRGDEGRIEVPGLGARIATMDKWTLKRREDTGPTAGTWTLHAVLSYQNDLLLLEDDLPKRVTVFFRKDQRIELTFKTLKVVDRNLVLEGVEPHYVFSNSN